MALLKRLALAFFLSCFSCCLNSLPSLASSSDEFLQCLREKTPSELVYEQSSNNFSDVLVSSIRFPNFFTNTTVRPLCIVTPTDADHVQTAVLCGRRHGVRLRVRSGGHDYEGISYRSVRAEVFAVVDLAQLHSISVAVDEHDGSTAWVDSGATVGELYYAIGKSSSQLTFPAGECPTLGVCGQFSGGGVGMLMRKYSVKRLANVASVAFLGDVAPTWRWSKPVKGQKDPP